MSTFLKGLTASEARSVVSLLDDLKNAGFDFNNGTYEEVEEFLDLQALYRWASASHYTEALAPLREFLLNERYLGTSGQSIYPQWMEDLERLFEGKFTQAVISGSIGSGKTTFAVFGLAREFYELCMMVDPQSAFGLMPGREIVLVCFNRDKKLARDVTFGDFKRTIEMSPFFRDELGIKFGTSELVYEKKNIRVIAVSVKSADALGRNVFGGIIDETEFLEGSTLRTHTLRPGQKPFAELLHSSIMRRIRSRYDRAGIVPGKLFLCSSAREIDSFTNKMMVEAAGDADIFVRDYALYDVKPKEQFSKTNFHVLVGNARVSHRIIEDDEFARITEKDRLQLEEQGCRIVEVPDNFKKEFVRNIEDAVRDICGIATPNLSPFIQVKEKIQEAVDPTLAHPAKSFTWKMGQSFEINWSRLSKMYSKRIGAGHMEEYLAPLRHPEAVRHVHIDLSLGRQDPAGMCIAHVADMVDVERRNFEGELVIEQAPLIEVDFCIQIVKPANGEIDIASVRGLVYDFVDHGYTFAFASADMFQSAEMLQRFRAQGVPAEVVSVDKTTDPYDYLKLALYEGRLSYYKHPILLEELERLQRVATSSKLKVDHPQGGCFVGRTRIPLLDGSFPEIRELEGKTVWVYASTEDGRIVPGCARGRMTKMATELVDVVLDSGDVERCTPEHPWRLQDGSYKRARDLASSVDRLMSINGGYELATGKAVQKRLTHHVVKVREVIPIHLEEPVPVFDLEVDDHSNFALSSGVFVHNSKDCADSLAGVVYTLSTKLSHRMPILMGISEYEGDREVDDAWIRSTMQKSGDKPPVPVGPEGPLVFMG